VFLVVVILLLLLFNTIQYITISSTGNATDFGDLLYGTGVPGACASSSRGVFLGGGSPANINI
jgi:hypothetical protein